MIEILLPLLALIPTVVCVVLVMKMNGLREHIKESAAVNEQYMNALKADLINNINQQQNQVLITSKSYLDSINSNLVNLTQLNDSKFESLKISIEDKLYKMQSDNADKLEKIRYTVEEKLQETLENRLVTSFKSVADHLEQVHKGLGEMQSLASGVGDLRKIFSNVKTRGVWGEVQLEAILEQVLAPAQYEKNAQIKENSGERVEFALKLPTLDSKCVLLPIDSKLPLEPYERLLSAFENSALDQIDMHKKGLEAAIKKQAKEIAQKYIYPPVSTEFAILFLPIEGLYAEVLNLPGLVDTLQREYKIIVTGPMTLSALLSSLQIGYRAIAIEKRSSEVWKVLGTLKREFSKFTSIIAKTREKLDQAVKVINTAESKSQLISKHLQNIESDIDTSTNDNSMILDFIVGAEDDK